MNNKPSRNYKSPVIELFFFGENDILTISGDNFFKWDWNGEKPFDNGLFN